MNRAKRIFPKIEVDQVGTLTLEAVGGDDWISLTYVRYMKNLFVLFISHK